MLIQVYVQNLSKISKGEDKEYKMGSIGFNPIPILRHTLAKVEQGGGHSKPGHIN